MATKKRGLGRGLDALLGEAQPVTSVEKTQNRQSLPIEFLQRGKYQPRKDMNPEALQDLADSIKAQGIIQPVVVRLIADNQYEIIAGERRWRAAQLAALQEVPVLIKQIDDRSAMAVALIENIQREDLNALEEAEALKRLLDALEMTHQQVADAIGKSRTTVSNLLRLLDLKNEVKNLLGKGLIEMGHARALLSLDGDVQIEVANRVVKQNLTVRAVEKLIKDWGSEKIAKKKQPDADTLRLQEQLSEKMGAKVTINHQNNGRGKLVFNYTSLEELEGIIGRIR
ncbi:MAG: ParB/RepB/Spo0J family partition protein [Methylococcales symbiont of Hymedesmia sp. n. MRB-2018]|nr:MAG: ParB/RepB/Spo0J family partition protein [Methylococcales symbiont of Hymedesmia sp. n. MRB-2018]KAF3984193.1 MAG: ParB/RepB/Spo0J family partition protein [Methylococcales symbiont of Hymedesmia sp. n. MRB-2018]